MSRYTKLSDYHRRVVPESEFDPKLQLYSQNRNRRYVKYNKEISQVLSNPSQSLDNIYVLTSDIKTPSQTEPKSRSDTKSRTESRVAGVKADHDEDRSMNTLTRSYDEIVKRDWDLHWDGRRVIKQSRNKTTDRNYARSEKYTLYPDFSDYFYSHPGKIGYIQNGQVYLIPQINDLDSGSNKTREILVENSIKKWENLLAEIKRLYEISLKIESLLQNNNGDLITKELLDHYRGLSLNEVKNIKNNLEIVINDVACTETITEDVQRCLNCDETRGDLTNVESGFIDIVNAINNYREFIKNLRSDIKWAIIMILKKDLTLFGDELKHIEVSDEDLEIYRRVNKNVLEYMNKAFPRNTRPGSSGVITTAIFQKWKNIQQQPNFGDNTEVDELKTMIIKAIYLKIFHDEKWENSKKFETLVSLVMTRFLTLPNGYADKIERLIETINRRIPLAAVNYISLKKRINTLRDTMQRKKLESVKVFSWAKNYSLKKNNLLEMKNQQENLENEIKKIEDDFLGLVVGLIISVSRAKEAVFTFPGQTNDSIEQKNIQVFRDKLIIPVKKSLDQVLKKFPQTRLELIVACFDHIGILWEMYETFTDILQGYFQGNGSWKYNHLASDVVAKMFTDFINIETIRCGLPNNAFPLSKLEETFRANHPPPEMETAMSWSQILSHNHPLDFQQFLQVSAARLESNYLIQFFARKLWPLLQKSMYRYLSPKIFMVEDNFASFDNNVMVPQIRALLKQCHFPSKVGLNAQINLRNQMLDLYYAIKAYTSGLYLWDPSSHGYLSLILQTLQVDDNHLIISHQCREYIVKWVTINGSILKAKEYYAEKRKLGAPPVTQALKEYFENNQFKLRDLACIVSRNFDHITIQNAHEQLLEALPRPVDVPPISTYKTQSMLEKLFNLIFDVYETVSETVSETVGESSRMTISRFPDWELAQSLWKNLLFINSPYYHDKTLIDSSLTLGNVSLINLMILHGQILINHNMDIQHMVVQAYQNMNYGINRDKVLKFYDFAFFSKKYLNDQILTHPPL